MPRLLFPWAFSWTARLRQQLNPVLAPSSFPGWGNPGCEDLAVLGESSRADRKTWNNGEKGRLRDRKRENRRMREREMHTEREVER
jgi:hypothetical protein